MGDKLAEDFVAPVFTQFSRRHDLGDVRGKRRWQTG
jgi:hypothetical protein